MQSNKAKAGARSEEAREKTRNQRSTKPRAMNPVRPARSIARRRGIAANTEGAGEATGAPSTKFSFLLLLKRYAAAPTVVFMQAAMVTEPDCPKLRSRSVAQR